MNDTTEVWKIVDQHTHLVGNYRDVIFDEEQFPGMPIFQVPHSKILNVPNAASDPPAVKKRRMISKFNENQVATKPTTDIDCPPRRSTQSSGNDRGPNTKASSSSMGNHLSSPGCPAANRPPVMTPSAPGTRAHTPPAMGTQARMSQATMPSAPPSSSSLPLAPTPLEALLYGTSLQLHVYLQNRIECFVRGIRNVQ